MWDHTGPATQNGTLGIMTQHTCLNMLKSIGFFIWKREIMDFKERVRGFMQMRWKGKGTVTADTVSAS